MTKRSPFVAAAAGSALVALGTVVRARRRGRVDDATRGIGAAIMPTTLHGAESVAPQSPIADESHAPGHQHLHWSEETTDEARPRPVRERPFAKHRHGLRHPGRG